MCRGRPRTNQDYSVEYGYKPTLVCPVCKNEFKRYSSLIKHERDWSKGKAQLCCSKHCAAILRKLSEFGKAILLKINNFRRQAKQYVDYVTNKTKLDELVSIVNTHAIKPVVKVGLGKICPRCKRLLVRERFTWDCDYCEISYVYSEGYLVPAK